MFATFCLRLAVGLLACLFLLPPGRVNPRFFRTHFLTALGLTVLAAVFLRETADAWLWLALLGGIALAFAGSPVWLLEGAPGGRLLTLLTVPALAAALLLAGAATRGQVPPGWRVADDLTSAALLGSAVTAMLMGHSYLIAPAMSLTPLLRLL